MIHVLLTGSAQFDCKSAGCEDPDSHKCYGTCIHKYYVNDGDGWIWNNNIDCADGSDEGITGMCTVLLLQNKFRSIGRSENLRGGGK